MDIPRGCKQPIISCVPNIYLPVSRRPIQTALPHVSNPSHFHPHKRIRPGRRKNHLCQDRNKNSSCRNLLPPSGASRFCPACEQRPGHPYPHPVLHKIGQPPCVSPAAFQNSPLWNEDSGTSSLLLQAFSIKHDTSQNADESTWQNHSKCNGKNARTALSPASRHGTSPL